MPTQEIPNKDQLFEHLPKCENALIVTHQFPDMDAIGSCLALYEYLEELGIHTVVWSSQELGKDFQFLNKASDVLSKYPSEFQFDTLFVLDASHLNRVKNHQLIKIDPETVTVINIDHHSDNSHFGDINVISEISSVGEIMTLLLTELKATITPTIATALYAAISFDTGRFGHNNVTSQTLRLAATLLDAGADNFFVTQHIDENKSPEDFKLVRLAIEHLVTNHELRFVYTVIPNQYTGSHFKVIDFIRLLGDFDIFIVFQEIGPKKVKINIRSKNDFDVSEFAQRFGGGGHKRASGILIEEPVAKAKKTVIDELTKSISTF
jgi:bifunctional oligoribonuclease and PAP phosphatase NrnA